jgi:hypothetical protein
MIESADVAAVFDLERDPASAAGARRAGVADEQVTRQRSYSLIRIGFRVLESG